MCSGLFFHHPLNWGQMFISSQATSFCEDLVYLRVYLYTHAHVQQQRPEERVWLPRARVTGCCEPPNTGAESGMWCLWKSSKHSKPLNHLFNSSPPPFKDKQYHSIHIFPTLLSSLNIPCSIETILIPYHASKIFHLLTSPLGMNRWFNSSVLKSQTFWLWMKD